MHFIFNQLQTIIVLLCYISFPTIDSKTTAGRDWKQKSQILSSTSVIAHLLNRTTH